MGSERAIDETVTPVPARGLPRACIVCAGAEGRDVFDNRMAVCAGYDFSTPIRYCVRCGMAFTATALSASDLHRYYAQFSKYDTLRSAADVSAIDRERIALAIDFLGADLCGFRSVLDVGCSAGAFLGALRAAGAASVLGIDPAADAAVKARELFDIEVCQAQAEAYADYGSHDLICLMAVLEHLREPAQLLRKLGRQMRAGARLLLEVPDAGAFDRPGDARPIEAWGEFSNEHLNFFAVRDVERLGRDAGFEVERFKALRLSGGGPDLFVLLRRAADPRPLPQADAGGSVSRIESGEAMRQYLARCREAADGIEQRLREACRGPIVIYGAGNHTARLLAQSPTLKETEIRAVFDRNPHLHGQTIGGIPILPAEHLQAHPHVPVIISTLNARREIHAALAARTQQPLIQLYS